MGINERIRAALDGKARVEIRAGLEELQHRLYQAREHQDESFLVMARGELEGMVAWIDGAVANVRSAGGGQ